MEKRTEPALSPLLLAMRGVVKTFGRSTAVDGIDLDVPERAFLTLLGPSGCGKTTVLRMIAGFETPDSGDMRLDNTPLVDVPPERRPVNTVFQSYALFPHLTVNENVAFSLKLRGGVPDMAARVRRALDAVHMADFGDRYPHQLSGGQQQRVAVARAIIAEPRLLLLDEPLSALDRKMRGHLQIELKALQRRLGIAFVYVTHDQEEAFALSDVVVVMNKGRIAQKADPQTIYSRPADSFVADFIGNSTLVKGQVRERHGDMATIETPLGNVTAPVADGLAAGDPAVLVIRPELLSVHGEGTTTLIGTVGNCVFQGERSMIEADVAGVALRFAAEAPYSIGSSVPLWLDAGRSFITRVAT
ncbi:Spermidine/putrescine import ATP-binding protein PotA [Pleomorphomonas sp. T1.2MG-36]|uniref:ABC transporter ATP-binding protein n=1 Tax=Pleomorphomonas sp. T1.2MG-36 TaxID=3041167 RepID=UPI002477A849|nr:ABC transporter ATP-binding protein [Pleomorphomonas sp. T1.2MG-36]CAI9414540.1 Spermidine/putrescine import ATP-binding protein PotA [Pleomorphomonas sp. T1.2MG-36]